MQGAEYLQIDDSVPRNIILRPDIEQSIFLSGENSLRQRQIRQEKKGVHLEEEYKKYTEQQRVRKALEDSFANTDYEGLIERIMGVLAPQKSLKLLYLDSVKQFGKRDGLSIYHKVMQII